MPGRTKKTSYILLRVDADDKRLISAAARQAGTNMTGFLLRPALDAARKSRKPPPTREPVVKSFKRHLELAKLGGGTKPEGRVRTDDERGYRLLGVRLVQELDRRRDRRLKNLQADRAWFEQHLAECWKLVPYRRRSAFLVGVRMAMNSRARRRA